MKRFLLTPLLALLLMVATTALAEISEQEAASIAQSVHPGRVLSVKLVQPDNGLATGLVPAKSSKVFRVKTLSAGGDVHIIVIDANSGKVLSK